MSTHGCFATPFPLLPYFRLLQPDGGSLEPDATVDDDYYTGGAYYHVTDADDQE